MEPEENKAERARTLFLRHANCAQAVLGAFHEECGLDFDTAMRLASGFGAGMSRLREICGAVSGMVMAANLLRGYSNLNDKQAKDAHYAFIRQLTGEFEREAGSLICRELLGLPSGRRDEPVSEERTAEYYRKRPCPEMVALAAAILQRHLKETAGTR